MEIFGGREYPRTNKHIPNKVQRSYKSTFHPGGKMEKRYDLEERTFKFTKRVIEFVKRLPRSMTNIEITGQLVRASGSVGANYIEANEALGRRDFFMKIRICRRESKESRYWLKLIDCAKEDEMERASLIDESTQLLKIFSSIAEKSSG